MQLDKNLAHVTHIRSPARSVSHINPLACSDVGYERCRPTGDARHRAGRELLDSACSAARPHAGLLRTLIMRTATDRQTHNTSCPPATAPLSHNAQEHPHHNRRLLSKMLRPLYHNNPPPPTRHKICAVRRITTSTTSVYIIIVVMNSYVQ